LHLIIKGCILTKFDGGVGFLLFPALPSQNRRLL